MGKGVIGEANVIPILPKKPLSKSFQVKSDFSVSTNTRERKEGVNDVRFNFNN